MRSSRPAAASSRCSENAVSIISRRARRAFTREPRGAVRAGTADKLVELADAGWRNSGEVEPARAFALPRACHGRRAERQDLFAEVVEGGSALSGRRLLVVASTGRSARRAAATRVAVADPCWAASAPPPPDAVVVPRPAPRALERPGAAGRGRRRRAARCCRPDRPPRPGTRSCARSAATAASTAPTGSCWRRGSPGSGSGSGASRTCSSPSRCTTTLPGRGADSDQPSQPASTSCAWYGAPATPPSGPSARVSGGALEETGVGCVGDHRAGSLYRRRPAGGGGASATAPRRRPTLRAGTPRVTSSRFSGPAVPATHCRVTGWSAGEAIAGERRRGRPGRCRSPLRAGRAARSSSGRRSPRSRAAAASCATYCSSLSADASGSRSSTREAILVAEADERAAE